MATKYAQIDDSWSNSTTLWNDQPDGSGSDWSVPADGDTADLNGHTVVADVDPSGGSSGITVIDSVGGGTLYVSGYLYMYGTLDVYGILYVNSGGYLNVNGTLNVGGTLYVNSGGHIVLFGVDLGVYIDPTTIPAPSDVRFGKVTGVSTGSLVGPSALNVRAGISYSINDLGVPDTGELIVDGGIQMPGSAPYTLGEAVSIIMSVIAGNSTDGGNTYTGPDGTTVEGTFDSTGLNRTTIIAVG